MGEHWHALWRLTTRGDGDRGGAAGGRQQSRGVDQPGAHGGGAARDCDWANGREDSDNDDDAGGGRQAVPKAGTPGIVPNIEFYDKTATSVSVRWGQPSDGGGRR